MRCGADFRPEYQALGGVIAEHYSGAPVLALTATATPRVKRDIMTSLHIQGCAQFQVRDQLTSCIIYISPRTTHSD